MTEGLASAIDRIVAGPHEADDVLRETVALLAREPGVLWVGIAFQDQGELSLGPTAGSPDESQRTRTLILYQGAPVGELWLDGELDAAQLERVAERIAPHVLIGWDTAGQAWDP